MQITIVGGGFAGISTAYQLARRGVKDVVVIEQEDGPGCHASGRNAGLLRRSCPDPVIAGMLRDGARAAARLLSRTAAAFTPSGSLILGSGAQALVAGPNARVVEGREFLKGVEGRGLFDPDDAIIDPHALLQIYERGARKRGVVFRYGERLVDIEVHQGRVRAVVTSRARVETSAVIVAAGAWAGVVAAMAGSNAIPIFPKRRHLFRASVAGSDPRVWPFVWDDESGVYFLPEGGELLASPCDVTPHEPVAPVFDADQQEILARKLGDTFPRVGEWAVGSGWACLRTFTGDDRFLIGPDPTVGGLFWVAALGGHGVTASWAVGQFAAEVFLGRREAGPLDPARFARR
jgi:sarcosine oxidase subunit beta